MTTLPLPVDAATTADDAADYLVQMHREGCINLHAHAPLSAFVHEFFGGFERDGMDVAQVAEYLGLAVRTAHVPSAHHRRCPRARRVLVHARRASHCLSLGPRQQGGVPVLPDRR